jgi:uncharacterized protein (DUF2236 family)
VRTFLSTKAWLDAGRDRIVSSTVELFSHGPDPLERTLDYQGDPGLFGPQSVTWPVLGDTAAFIGGIRALVVQAAHPEVAAGVGDHSRYREDPLGRLSRTSAYVTATAFGAAPEVTAAIAIVRARHRRVTGVSHRDRPYDAAMPGLAAWVHHSLTDSFLVAYQRFGPSRRLSEADADRFVAEQVRIGELLGVEPLPTTAAELAGWLAEHPCVGSSPSQRIAIDFLRRPPLPLLIRLAYGFLFRAAVATVPRRLRAAVGLRRRPGAIMLGKVVAVALRWSLGSSPAWHLALVRVGAPSPVRFRQPLPPQALGPTKRSVSPSVTDVRTTD